MTAVLGDSSFLSAYLPVWMPAGDAWQGWRDPHPGFCKHPD